MFFPPGGIEGDRELCYVIGDSASGAVLHLYSDDMGGPEQAVMGFRLVASPAPHTRCVSVPLTTADLEIDRGIKLGMTVGQLQHLFGSAGRATDSTTVEYSDSTLYRRYPPDPTPNNPNSAGYSAWTHYYTDARFRRGVLVEVRVWKVTTS